MGRLLRKYRCWVRRIAAVAVLLFCAGAIHASHHWHDTDCADDVCAVCLFTDSGTAASDIAASAGHRLCAILAGTQSRSFVPASRPFEPRRTRAPPIS